MPTLLRVSRRDVITVAIIDDYRLMREAISAMLEDVSDMRVIASPTVDAAFLANETPHVVLLAAGLGGHEGLRAAVALRQELPDVKIIVTHFNPAHDEIMAFVNAGVSGFVCSEAGLDEVAAAVRTVASGGRVLPPSMTKPLFSEISRPASGPRNPRMQQPVHMTRREHEVIDLIGAGFCNKEIAQRLNIATHTVKTHVRNVMEKLAVHTRLQIAAHVHRSQGQQSQPAEWTKLSA